MICLRRIALRTSSVQSTLIYVRPRLIATCSSSSISRQQKPLFPLQKRWTSQSTTAIKPEAEEIEEAQHGRISTYSPADTEAPLSVDASDHQSVTSAIEASTRAGTHTSTTNEPRDFSLRAPRDHPTDSKAGASRGLYQNKTSQLPNSVYVGNIYFDTPDAKIKDLMGGAGEIVSFGIVKDINGLSRGFGYVSYKTSESMRKAIELFDAKYFEGRYLIVQESRNQDRKVVTPARGSSTTPSHTLFIGNMPFDMSDRDLNDLFARVKNVTDVRVAIDRRTGQPRGFAHADFVDVESAMKGMEDLQGLEVLGRSLRVDYSFPAPHHRAADTPEEPL